MYISEQILEKLLTDNDFSLELAKVCKVTQWAIIQRVKRKSKTLLLPECIEFYKKYGLENHQIFDYQTDESRNSLQCHSSIE